MKGNYSPEIVKLIIDTLIYETPTPITVSSVVSKLVGLNDNNPIINVVNDSYLDSESIELLKEVISIYEQTQLDLIECIQEFISESSNLDDLQEYIEELERIKQLTLILKSMVKENMVFKPEDEEEYIFITLEDPDRKDAKGNPISILARDVDATDSEVVLRHLLKMEKLVKSQLYDKGKFDLKGKGNGMHSHDSHTLYKHVGDMIRIQVRRTGKEGNIIAVLAISPPSEVHRNSNGENIRTALYERREQMLTDFLNGCERDEDGTYIISEEELTKLQGLYISFKKQLQDNIKGPKSSNISVLEELCKKITKNLEKEKVA